MPKQLNLRLDDATYDRLKAVAEKRGMTLTSLVLSMVERDPRLTDPSNWAYAERWARDREAEFRDFFPEDFPGDGPASGGGMADAA